MMGGVTVHTMTQQHFLADTCCGVARVNAPANRATSTITNTSGFSLRNCLTDFHLLSSLLK
jgi:hypothetical protein